MSPMRARAWSWVIGLVNAALLAFLGNSFALYGSRTAISFRVVLRCSSPHHDLAACTG